MYYVGSSVGSKFCLCPIVFIFWVRPFWGANPSIKVSLPGSVLRMCTVVPDFLGTGLKLDVISFSLIFLLRYSIFVFLSSIFIWVDLLLLFDDLLYSRVFILFVWMFGSYWVILLFIISEGFARFLILLLSENIIINILEDE